MGKKVSGKFVWVIKNFSSVQSEKIYSDPFVIGGCKWQLLAYPKGDGVDYFSLYLEDLADCASLPYDLDYDDEYLSEEHYFDKPSPAFAWRYPTPSETLAEDDGFEESIPVGSVRRIFERHPDIAVRFRAKNKHLRTTFMNFLLSLIETLCQPLEELSHGDIVEAGIALTYVKDVGFEVDWYLTATTKANQPQYLFLYLLLAYGPSLPSGWKRYVKYRLTIVNQLADDLSVIEDGLHWFDSGACNGRFPSMFYLSKLHDCGFLVNGELKHVVEVQVLKVIGASEKSEKASKPLRRIDVIAGAETNNLHSEASSLKESMDVNGFQVLPSQIAKECSLICFLHLSLLYLQVESVRCVFERHPDIAVEFHAKNQHLRNACMNFLLSLIETLCQSLQELSIEDLVEADIALTYLKDSGFKVDWLDKKLDQLKENKEKEQFCLARLQEMEDMFLDLDALVEKEEAELSATRAPLSFDDVV
ncbi:unnamed protein product [Thlaspi arvense]|uniref:MATH domain-containing protein n=1 Tax=Thlaspi arvense TaxID=13288 RepID=A0AAU9S9N2_THLAR|nr:unnamed protein product [Thlaspi arvense]